MEFPDWEDYFRKGIQGIDPGIRQKAGSFLSFLPDEIGWSDFQKTAKKAWPNWKNNLADFSNSLIGLYSCVAFYEYGEHKFWSKFSAGVGDDSLLSANTQTEINKVFGKALERVGISLIKHGKNIDYVGSAIYRVGIPLSLWDGFLGICEWAFWEKDWKKLADDAWSSRIQKIVGGRRRLLKFVCENRNTSEEFIDEMLDAKKLLSEDNKLTLDQIKTLCLLRPQYFDNVPETADFLRPENPDSLFKGKPCLSWSERRRTLSIFLPAVDEKLHPANWILGSLEQEASTSPDEIIVNSLAFQKFLDLRLNTNEGQKLFPSIGANNCGLFDVGHSGKIVNRIRDKLPLGSYVLVSKDKLEKLDLEGFDTDENPPNEEIQLNDGTTCYISKLWTNSKLARLHFGSSSENWEVKFCRQSKLEIKFYFGFGPEAICFIREGNKILLDKMPTICAVIPFGYFDNPEKVLNENFRIMVDQNSGNGNWKIKPNLDDEEKQYFVWEWGSPPFYEIKTGLKLKLEEIGSAIQKIKLHGPKTLVVVAKNYGYKKSLDIDFEDKRFELKHCFSSLPGAYLPVIILAQEKEGMKWDEIMIAKDLIQSNQRLSFYLFKKYATEGIFRQFGRRWLIGESRATLNKDGEKLIVEYCGDPTHIWSLYRKMIHIVSVSLLPNVEVVNKRGELPYLKMVWLSKVEYEINKHFKAKNIKIGKSLWIH